VWSGDVESTFEALAAQVPAGLNMGGPNDVWSFGEKAYDLTREQLALRERIRPYVMDQMATASATGLPPMGALFLEFPEEAPAWEVSDQYVFGPDVLVAPVTAQGARERNVYLPVGASWLDAWTGEPVKKAGRVTAAAPLDRIPVYVREGGGLRDLSPSGREPPGRTT
jgi:alpha-D-xyloside xylohydrolase